MTYNEIIIYIEELATAHVDILHSESECHFLRDHEDADNKLRTKISLPAVIVGPHEEDVKARNEDATFTYPVVSFMILDKVAVSDVSKKIEVKDKCRQIALDFISKFRKDAFVFEKNFSNLDLNAIHIEEIGPVLDNFYGVLCDFKILSPVDLEYNEDKWN